MVKHLDSTLEIGNGTFATESFGSGKHTEDANNVLEMQNTLKSPVAKSKFHLKDM